MARFLSAMTLVVCLASANALNAQEMIKPLGKWERKVGKTRVTLSIEDTRLHINCSGDKFADQALRREPAVTWGIGHPHPLQPRRHHRPATSRTG